MAGRIPQHFLDELIARADIVELIGSRVPLKKAGREFKACCPFHNEKSPSFWVSPEKQFYHCFGCGAHGTALSFLMNYDRLDFLEAVEELAQRLGLEVPHEAGGPDTRAPQDGLYDLMARVAEFYRQALRNDARARDYVTQKRGLAPETIERFLLGYAPDSWNEVLKRFGTADAQRRSLAAAGLVIERDATQARAADRYYDRFRDRVMFPIRDARGRVIAFGGRIIDQGEPKYLNSPETDLFHKGRELYGLYEVRQSRIPLQRLLVVEGYMDAVRLHQAGIQNAVATLGTATTPEHLKRIFRLVSEVVFCFDGDRAGRAAAWRALNNALPEAREGRQIKFLFLPEGHDPDSLVAAEGRAAFETRLAATLPLSEYLVRELSDQVDLAHADGRARLAAAARPLVARIPAGVFQELVTGRVAAAVGLPAERLQQLWAQSAGDRDQREPSATTRTPAVSGKGVVAGRGGFVTQAMRILVHFPSIATQVSPALIARLERQARPDVAALLRYLDELRAQPLELTAQLLQRCTERPEYGRLADLAKEPMPLQGTVAALPELIGALAGLVAESQARRFEELAAKDRSLGLSAEEKLEFQKLMSNARGGS